MKVKGPYSTGPFYRNEKRDRTCNEARRAAQKDGPVFASCKVPIDARRTTADRLGPKMDVRDRQGFTETYDQAVFTLTVTSMPASSSASPQ